MFSGATQSSCGFAQSAMGPFYCPMDQKVYLDTSFFRDLEQRFRGCDAGSKTCQFSQAYVIAHEIRHHVQNQLGVLPKVEQAKQGVEKAEANALQVRVELQADCLAGVWANRAQAKWQFIEPGDVEAALQTASAIGDDRLQRQSQGYVVPDAFTHGSSAQRTRWFTTGLNQGKSLGEQSRLTFRADALRTSVFRGSLPRPASLNFGLQRETEESSNDHYAASRPTLSGVSGAVIVAIMSAPTSNSSPSRIPRPTSER
jgi:predicted metalloprotease